MAKEGMNLASKFAKKIDERFTRESQAMMGTNQDFDWVGVDTVNVYSIPTTAMNDYKRSGSNRYGTPNEQGRNIQTMKLSMDRGATETLDRGNRQESQMVNDAGKWYGRQTREVWIPEYDAFIFRKQAAAAIENGAFDNTPITKENAYEMFLAANEYLGNHNVPDKGRICYCSYRFANLMKQDPAFMKTGDKSQGMLERGVIGEVDGTKIVKVPSGRLPSGCSFLMVHPSATCAPKTLNESRVHQDPPGISGWLMEMRVIYDAFVLDEKVDALYYHGGADTETLRTLSVDVAEQPDGKFVVNVNPGVPETGNKFMYKLGASKTAVTPNQDLGSASFKPLAKSGEKITVSGEKFITVCEATSGNLAKGVGSCKIVKSK